MDYLAHIEIGKRIVTLDAESRYTRRSIRTNIILAVTNVGPYLAPCVVREKVEPVAELPFETCLQRVIVAVALRRYIAGITRKIRIWNIQLWVCIGRQQFGYVIGTRRRDQVASQRAHIGKRG